MMHCPSCGQQQVSNEIKFCSRCGFPMGLVSEILAHGGFLPQLADLHKKKRFWNRKNGIFLSLMLTFICWFLLTPLAAIVDFEEGAAFFGIVGFFLGIFGVATSLFFLPSSKVYDQQFQPQSQSAQMPPMPHQNARPLPPQQSIPVEDYIQPGHWKAPDTDQLIKQGSVTDSTTKLLERDTK